MHVHIAAAEQGCYHYEQRSSTSTSTATATIAPAAATAFTAATTAAAHEKRDRCPIELRKQERQTIPKRRSTHESITTLSLTHTRQSQPCVAQQGKNNWTLHKITARCVGVPNSNSRQKETHFKTDTPCSCGEKKRTNKQPNPTQPKPTMARATIEVWMYTSTTFWSKCFLTDGVP